MVKSEAIDTAKPNGVTSSQTALMSLSRTAHHAIRTMRQDLSTIAAYVIAHIRMVLIACCAVRDSDIKLNPDWLETGFL